MATITPGQLAGPFDLLLRFNGGAISGLGTNALEGPIYSDQIRQNTIFGGSDNVSGQVLINGAPALAYVRVHDTKSGIMVAGGWTDLAGNFSFQHLRSDLTYYAIAFDYIGGEQAYVFDQI